MRENGARFTSTLNKVSRLLTVRAMQVNAEGGRHRQEVAGEGRRRLPEGERPEVANARLARAGGEPGPPPARRCPSLALRDSIRSAGLREDRGCTNIPGKGLIRCALTMRSPASSRSRARDDGARMRRRRRRRGGGGDAISVNLSPVGDASQFGTATLTPDGDQTRVVLDVDSPVSNSQPAHIHEGTCDNLTRRARVRAAERRRRPVGVDRGGLARHADELRTTRSICTCRRRRSRRTRPAGTSRRPSSRPHSRAGAAKDLRDLVVAARRAWASGVTPS